MNNTLIVLFFLSCMPLMAQEVELKISIDPSLKQYREGEPGLLNIIIENPNEFNVTHLPEITDGFGNGLFKLFATKLDESGLDINSIQKKAMKGDVKVFWSGGIINIRKNSSKTFTLPILNPSTGINWLEPGEYYIWAVLACPIPANREVAKEKMSHWGSAFVSNGVHLKITNSNESKATKEVKEFILSEKANMISGEHLSRLSKELRTYCRWVIYVRTHKKSRDKNIDQQIAELLKIIDECENKAYKEIVSVRLADLYVKIKKYKEAEIYLDGIETPRARLLRDYVNESLGVGE